MHSSSFTSEGPQEDEEIKCPKCFSFFSSLTKPYILPCNHNICLNCINALIDKKNPKCPICSFHFDKKDKNSFEVNFTFLNIIIKILETKIIFCPQCNKIFYWKEHYKFCEQKNFQNCDNILEEIKINCQESAKILKLVKENGDLLNKYKIELYNVTNNIMKEIHKKYINKVKSNIKNKLFKSKITIDFQKVKYDMINFIKLFLPYSEYFDTSEISKIIENNNHNKINNANILCNSYSDIKNKTKALIHKKSVFSPCGKNLVYSEKKYQTIINNNDMSKKINNKISKFLNNKNMRNKNTMREILSEVKESEEDLSLPPEVTIFDDEGVQGTERVKIKKYHDNNISKFKKINILSPEEMNKENKSTIHNEKSILKKNIENDLTSLNQQIHQKKNSKFDIKSILNTEDIDEDNIKNKIIVGLKDIKVISLKQSTQNLNNNKLNVNLIKSKMKLSGKKIILGNINNFMKKNLKNNNINENIKKDNNNNNGKLLKKINFDTPSLSLLRSTEFTKRDFRYTPNNQNLNKNTTKKNKNNALNINMSLASTTSGFNNLLDEANTPYIINHSSTKENLSSRNNTKKIYTIPQKNSTFVNENMLKNYNDTKESAGKLKKYYELIKFLSSTINTSVNHNISLLNDIIMSNYDLLLSEIAFKSPRVQKNFCFSFFPNTYNILLYDPFNKKFTFKNYNHVLNKKGQTILKPFDLSNSIIFDDNDLIYITGGISSYDKIIILSLSNENIIYNKAMPCGKAFHKTIFINNKLYILGGEMQNKKVSSECFCFDLSKKKWNSLPHLKKARKNFSICFYNDSVLYVFMGEDDKNLLDSVEFIDINNLNNKKIGWTIFKPIDYGYVWHSMKNALVINIDRDKILICGGEYNEKNLYKDCFLFKPSTNNVFKGIDLKVPAAFISEGCLYKDEIFGFDYRNKTQNHFLILHIYNTKNNFWKAAYINNIK